MSKVAADPVAVRLQQQRRLATERLQKYHSLGKQILSVEEQSGCVTGDAIEQVGWAGSLDTAYKARQFANLISDELFQAMTSDDAKFTLTWTHMVTLLSVRDEVARERHLQSVLKNGWSTAQLRAAIGVRAPKRHKSGRRFAPLKTWSQACQALKRHFDRPHKFLDKLLEQSTLVDSKDVRKALKNLKGAIKKVLELGDSARK